MYLNICKQFKSKAGMVFGGSFFFSFLLSLSKGFQYKVRLLQILKNILILLFFIIHRRSTLREEIIPGSKNDKKKAAVCSEFPQITEHSI